MAKLVDAPDLGSGAAMHGGSIPFAPTTLKDLLTRSFLHGGSPLSENLTFSQLLLGRVFTPTTLKEVLYGLFFVVLR